MLSYLKHIAIVFSILLLWACTDTPIPDDYAPGLVSCYLETQTTELTYDASESSQSFNLWASHSWEIPGRTSWLDISPSSGQGDAIVTASVSENFSADTVRSSILYISSMIEEWNYIKPISILQKAAIPRINTNPAELTVPGSSSTTRILVDSNTEWTASCDASWAEIAYDESRQYIDITVGENYTNEERVATVILTGATTKTFEVTQSASIISAETNHLIIERGGGTYTLEVMSDVSWTAETSYDWIEVTPDCGNAGKSIIYISASPNWSDNKRYATLRLYIGEYSAIVFLIEQEGVKLSAPEQVTFDAVGGSQDIQITGNIPWDILSKPEWISLSSNNGDGDSIIIATAENNTSTFDRSGTIELGKSGFSQKAYISVTQPGKHFAIDNDALTVGSRGGVVQISLNTNDMWETQLQDGIDWLNVISSSGVGSTTLDFTVADNPSVYSRSTVANVKPQDLAPVNISIKQNGRYITVNSNGVQFFSKGGKSRAITVETDSEYEIRCDLTWVTIHRDGNVFYVSADKNDTGHIREGDIILTLTERPLDGEMSLIVKITQTAPGGHFNKDDFNNDTSWDDGQGHKITVSIINYEKDQIWDDTGNHGLKLIITRFGEDIDWGSDLGQGGFNKDNYNEDENYDNDSVKK